MASRGAAVDGGRVPVSAMRPPGQLTKVADIIIVLIRGRLRLHQKETREIQLPRSRAPYPYAHPPSLKTRSTPNRGRLLWLRLVHSTPLRRTRRWTPPVRARCPRPAVRSM